VRPCLRVVTSSSIRLLTTKIQYKTVKVDFLLRLTQSITMALTQHERIFIQNQHASDFVTYLKSVWHVWPTLKYSHARRKASRLWKARKEWLKTLEPTPDSLKKNCDTCHSSFHAMWAPLVPITEEAPVGNSILTVTQWETMLDLEEPVEQQKNDVLCWGCKENQPNQLAHMDYGGCLYYDACDMGLVDPFDAISTLPPLPASPPSTD